MSKALNIIYLCLILTVMLAVGFLALQVTELKELYYSNLTELRNQATNKPTTGTENDSLTTLSTQMAEQDKTIAQLQTDLKTLSETITTPANTDCLAAPQYTLNDTIFTVNKNTATNFTVTGDLSKFTAWLEHNEIYLDYIAKKIIPFAFDKGSILVQDIITDSIFYQMGLRKGDHIIQVDGRAYAKGMDLRQKLIEQQNKQIVVQRQNQRLTFNVKFVNNTPATDTTSRVTLNLTQKEFAQKMKELAVNLKSNQPITSDLLSQMTLKTGDVVTKINGAPVTQTAWLDTLAATTGPVEIVYVRDNTPTTVQVSFNEP